MNEIERFIALMRDAVPDAEHVFTHGKCWRFYLLLRDRWPQAEPWSENDGSHILTKIGDYWYDIKGKHSGPQEGWKRADAHAVRRWKPHRWNGRSETPILTWTIRKPTKPGFYFFHKGHGDPRHVWVAQVCRVRDPKLGLFVSVADFGGGYAPRINHRPLTEVDGMWFGPLPKPEQPYE